MTTKTLEFNSIKTIRLINKDQLLQRVHIDKTGGYGFNTLLEAAENDKLTPQDIKNLKDIFNDIILVSDRHKTLYEEIKIKPDTKRRYGKKQIEVDIERQGGKATQLQNTMLNLAKLKAMQGNLALKGVSDQFNGTEKLSKSDLRAINAAVRDFEKKVKPILKKKRS